MEDFQLRAKHNGFPELNEWPWYVDDSVLKCKSEKAEPKKLVKAEQKSGENLNKILS